MKLRTWYFENLVVITILSIVAVYTGNSWKEWIGALAVFFTFCHANISERMREKEAIRSVPSVACYNLLTYFFFGKEACWFVYFVATHTWAALVGCILFIIYPFWRKLWRKYHPLKDI